MVFVAHQDDDLLFMNPDIQATIHAGGCVQVVYLTAAERGEGIGYMMGRARGVRAAYAYIAGTPNSWTEDVLALDGRHLAHVFLNGNPRVSMIYMRLKDPWLGKGWGSLTPLSRAESEPGTTAQSLGPYVETYDRAGLVDTLAAIISDYRPTDIRHMDDTVAIPYTRLCWRCVGHDHPDHIASARLVRAAMARAPGTYAEVAYVDYPTQERHRNLTLAEVAGKTGAFRHYAWDDYRYCAKGPIGCKEPLGPALSWVGRTYYVIRHTLAPALAAEPAGGYVLCATGEINSAANVRDSRLGRWLALGGRVAGSSTIYNRFDGTVEILVRGANGRLWTRARASGGHWAAWQMLAGPRLVELPLVAHSAAGRSTLLAMGYDGAFHYAVRQQADAVEPWRWSRLPVLADALRDAALALDANGDPAVFAADRKGGLWATWQAQDGSGRWAAWSRIRGVTVSGGLAARRNARGLIQLYARDGRSGHMLGLTQLRAGTPDQAWRAPEDMGIAYVGRPAIGLSPMGAVVVAALAREHGSVWLLEGGAVTSLGSGIASAPALRTIGDTLYVAGRSAGSRQDYWLWARSGGKWHAPRLLPAPAADGGESFNSLPPGIVPSGPFQAPVLSAKAETGAAALAK
ncbi:GlcNAc-PI de-N-acetylase [Candidimonas nitroreducens]|uniref:GlcNAc-PI de-N-acetylase n=1 Tax=Candidimonas nitroreducens TaxID=683354 RepID=A0A225MW13_9BURK|nr:GlcNAc-PI de-N-acetylase [Candidimonas nitroreducens]